MALDTVVMLCLIVVFLSLILLRLRNYLRAVRLAFILKGPPALPILGNVLLINDDQALENIGNKSFKTYGPISRYWGSVLPFFLITEPEHVQAILGSNKNSRKNIFYRLLHNIIGKGLVANNGSTWKLHRRLIQPYFHPSQLEKLIGIFAEKSANMLNELDGKNNVNLTTPINNCVLSILFETVLGIANSRDAIADCPFRNGQLVFQYRVTRPWLLFNQFFQFTSAAEKEVQQKHELRQYIKKVLDRKRQSLPQEEPRPYKCFLEIFMEISENNPEFTETDVIDEACTLMLAGQDSVDAALVFTLYLLSKHPEIQSKVMDELVSIFGKDKRQPCVEDLNNMKYLDQCIKEALRLYPSLPFVSRTLNEAVTLGKYTLPPEAHVFIAPFATHRLEHVFPNPQEFDPERFNPENIEKIPTFGYIPFSAGSRNCIGQRYAMLEMKTIISTLLRRYRLELKPGHQPRLSYKVTLRAKGGLPVILHRR